MKKLIVNADDFGFTSGVNAGIVRAFREGIVTSTTIMANGAAFEDAVELARRNPDLPVGCHLAILGGRPVADPGQVPSLVDSEGLMARTLSELIGRLLRRTIDPDDVGREFRAQLSKVLDAGIHPTHLDCHKHVHAHPRVMGALLRVAGEFGIRKVRNPFENPAWPGTMGPTAQRRRHVYLKQWGVSMSLRVGAGRFRRLVSSAGLCTPRYFCGMTLTGLLDLGAVEAVIAALRDGVTELACHPGCYDTALERAPTRLKMERERELEALTDPALRRCLAAHGVTLISYREIA